MTYNSTVYGNQDIAVIGVGNRFRRDDGVGCLIADAIAEKGLSGVRAIDHSGEGASLMEMWENMALVVIVDAVCADGMPGTICRFEANTEMIPSSFFNYSTHAFSVAESIELSKVLHRPLPAIIVYGIHGANFGLGRQLTPQVGAAIPEIVGQIMKDIRQFQNSGRVCVA